MSHVYAPQRRSTFVIHVCPACGYYDADPILKRDEGIRCSRCGQEAADGIDESRIHPAWRSMYRDKARRSAPVMEALTLVLRPQSRSSSVDPETTGREAA